MAQDHSAVPLGDADTRVDDGDKAHDSLGNGVDHGNGREAIRETTHAINAASLNLESTQMADTPSLSPDVEHQQTRLQDTSDDVIASNTRGEICVTPAHDSTKQVVNGIHNPDQVAQASLPIERPELLPSTPPPPRPTKVTPKSPSSAVPPENGHHEQSSNTASLANPDGAGRTSIPHEGNMVFGLQALGAGSASHRRRQYANTSALTDYEADLTGKDRAKQKEAVKRFLMEKIKSDWTWQWPRPDPEAQVDPEPAVEKQPAPDIELETEPALAPTIPVRTHESQESIVYEEQWKERDEWISNASESGEEAPASPRRGGHAESTSPFRSIFSGKEDPFRFENPDGVGETIKKTETDRKWRRKKRLAEEMSWNDGVRCFTERRDAWSGARRIAQPSPTKAGRLSSPQLQPDGSHASDDEGSSTAIDQEASDNDEEEWEADIEIPVAPPLIPPTNAMRSSISPSAYNTIYDKVILQQLTPSCPINLKDVTRSCVQGWKRDGEWPPQSSIPESLAGRRRRKLSMASLFGIEKTKSSVERDKVLKENAEKEAADRRDSVEHKPGPFKRMTQKLMLLGKDKEHSRNGSVGSINGKGKEVGVPHGA